MRVKRKIVKIEYAPDKCHVCQEEATLDIQGTPWCGSQDCAIEIEEFLD